MAICQYVGPDLRPDGTVLTLPKMCESAMCIPVEYFLVIQMSVNSKAGMIIRLVICDNLF
jgi:hypothetical protein